jgi:ferredoxin-thioredoxin reductase catalytic chain
MDEYTEIRKKFIAHINKTGIKFNPNNKIVEGIIKSLIERRKKFGDFYCPCRVVTKNKAKDSEIVCPCVYHRGEIELQGHCLCNLFVK